MRMNKKDRVEAGVTLIKEAVQIRHDINELYKKYHALTRTVGFAILDVQHHDLKRAIDALYYFGGGWPRETSKGRMEALLDNFVGMYRILVFIGEENIVKRHLAQYGVKVSIDPEFQIVNEELDDNEIKFIQREHGITVKDTRELTIQVVHRCMDLQRDICGLADKIKGELKPAAQDALGVEDEEYDRLHTLVKIRHKPDKVTTKRHKINLSVSNFELGASVLK